jgi:hypothetical protein
VPPFRGVHPPFFSAYGCTRIFSVMHGLYTAHGAALKLATTLSAATWNVARALDFVSSLQIFALVLSISFYAGVLHNTACGVAFPGFSFNCLRLTRLVDDV